MPPVRNMIVVAVLVAAAAISTLASLPGLRAFAAPAQVSTDAPYLAENEAAMRRMMSGMSITPTGDVDRDFVAMMVPHHQGAIDIAVALLRYGHNEKIRRLAQEIIVTQQEEIAAMRLAVGEKLPPPVAAPTAGPNAD